MKLLSFTLILAAGMLAGCGSVANNTATNNANLRGTNTNTGYVTNADAVAKPTVPPNATNLTPGNMTSGNGNSNANMRSNSNSNSNMGTSPRK